MKQTERAVRSKSESSVPQLLLILFLPHQLLCKAILWRSHFLNVGSLFSNDSSLYQVDPKPTKANQDKVTEMKRTNQRSRPLKKLSVANSV